MEKSRFFLLRLSACCFALTVDCWASLIWVGRWWLNPLLGGHWRYLRLESFEWLGLGYPKQAQGTGGVGTKKNNMNRSWSKRVAVSPLYHQIRCTVYRLYIHNIKYIEHYRTMFLKTGNAASVLGSGTWSICCGSKVKDLWWNRACRLVWWVRRMCSSCVTWTSSLRRFGRIYKYGPQCGQSHYRPPSSPDMACIRWRFTSGLTTLMICHGQIWQGIQHDPAVPGSASSARNQVCCAVAWEIYTGSKYNC